MSTCKTYKNFVFNNFSGQLEVNCQLTGSTWGHLKVNSHTYYDYKSIMLVIQSLKSFIVVYSNFTKLDNFKWLTDSDLLDVDDYILRHGLLD